MPKTPKRRTKKKDDAPFSGQPGPLGVTTAGGAVLPSGEVIARATSDNLSTAAGEDQEQKQQQEEDAARERAEQKNKR